MRLRGKEAAGGFHRWLLMRLWVLGKAVGEQGLAVTKRLMGDGGCQSFFSSPLRCRIDTGVVHIGLDPVVLGRRVMRWTQMVHTDSRVWHIDEYHVICGRFPAKLSDPAKLLRGHRCGGVSVAICVPGAVGMHGAGYGVTHTRRCNVSCAQRTRQTKRRPKLLTHCTSRQS